jgi:muramoyltetrapeptide carboxypeptidase
MPTSLTSRRAFLQVATVLPALGAGLKKSNPIRPQRLQPGQTIGIVSPATASFDPVDVQLATERLAAFGFEAKPGAHILDRRGYLAGSDLDRAADINAMFANPDVHGILALRGGWGSARLLPLLDYDLIAAHPKVFSGFSDITSLLLAIYARSGVTTFHGPDGLATWNAFANDYFRRLVMDGETLHMDNPVDIGDDLTQTEHRIRTISPGKARGRLAGGNLTVLSSIVGSRYLPAWENHILFLEDIGEDIYRIDRMMTQLKLAGILDAISGFVFGKCTRCNPDTGGYGGFTLHEVLADHILPLNIPAYSGAMIGHIRQRFSIPIGTLAEIDASNGTITLLEPAVV